MEYFFGFGADNQADMLKAVIGRAPIFSGRAILKNYQLCIQSLDDIPTKGDNPKKILENAWGSGFKSYTIRHHNGEQVHGSLFRITRLERRMLDLWELVDEGWQDSIKVRVVLDSGKEVIARTQCLPDGHNHGDAVNGDMYSPWLMSKENFIRIARHDSKTYSDRL